MKEIKLMNLTLKNFKGIKDLEINVNGNDLGIYGDNGTGKTTVPDGFLWNLFGKDSNNRTDFAIKTLLNGKEINNLEHEVEAKFQIDGHPLTLRKVYKEKYTKKRGAPIAEFTGHETNHYIDGVPVKKKEYEEKINAIVEIDKSKMTDAIKGEEAFKLITSPTYFNEQLKWQDQRSVLLQVCGNVEDALVIASNSELAGLPTILKGRTIEDHRKVIASRRAEINKELNMIPVRIDEINNSMPKEEIDVPSIEKQVAEIEKSLDENATLINNIKNGSAITAKQQELHWIEIDLKDIQNELEAESIEKGHQVNAKIQEEQSNIANLNRKKEDAEHQAKRNESDIEAIDAELIKLREDWTKENELTHTHHSKEECPTCNQSLPTEEVEAAKEKATAAFNLNKSAQLEKLNTLGKSKAETKKALLEQNEKFVTFTIAGLQTQIDEKEKAVAKLTTEVGTLRTAIVEARQDKRYTDKVGGKEKIEASIKTLQENALSAVSDIEKEVTELRTKRTELNAQIAQQAQATASLKRIGELEEQQKELAAEFEKLEHELYLTEQFIQSKVKLLEEKINSKFKYARFNLFKTNINGGIEEICETTFEGVPYSSGLNNAARINVGIDIINTLTEHYGIRAPIFVDNSEAVTRLANTESQLISLVVSEKDKQLRIEKQSVEEDGAA